MADADETCTRCGACCVTYRVAFRRHELDSDPGGFVPAQLCEAIDGEHACMRGTRRPPRRCVALSGTVGARVACTIYAQRPSPCREFAPAAADKHGDIACGDARRHCGLPPLGDSYDAYPVA